MDQGSSGDLTVAEAIGEGDDEHEWHSADGTIWCTYGRPRGVISPLINRILGPDNSANLFMQAQCRALLAIRTWCGKPSAKLVTGADFQAVVDRFGEDVDADDRFNSFVSEAVDKLYPNTEDEVGTAKK